MVKIETSIDTNSFTLTAKGEGFESQANVECQYQGGGIKICPQ